MIGQRDRARSRRSSTPPGAACSPTATPAMSTRKVATEAGVPLSQVHYHFGSKGGLVLALLEAEDRRLPRPPGRDVLRGGAAVEALRAGVRLPRGRPRVGLRPRAAGDDRRRVVEPGDRREGAGDAAGLVRAAHRRGDRGGRALRWARSVHAGGGRHVDRHARSSAPRRCCCSASTATSCRSAPPAPRRPADPGSSRRRRR